MSSKFKLVTFDAFNTLIKLNTSVGAIYATAVERILPGLSTNLSCLTEKINKEFPDVYRYHYKKYPNFGFGQMSSEYFWHMIVSTVLKNVAVDLDANKMTDVTRLLYKEFSTAKHWHVFEDATQVLHKLERSDIKVGVVSNFDERLDKIFTNLDIKKYFDFVICSYQSGCAKPNFQIFKLAVDMVGFKPYECVHVGDNLDLDYNAATKFGMKSYLINRLPENSFVKNSNFVLNSLLEFPI